MYKITSFLPTRIIFEVSAVKRLPEEAKKLGKKAMIVTGRHSTKESGLLDRVKKLLKDAGIESIVFDKVIPNPLSTHVDEAADIARKENIEFVIGLGGGSPIDTAKCVAVAAINDGGIWRFVDVEKDDIPAKALPIIAIPTTHGTGTEADPFAVLTNPETKEKIGTGYDVTFPAVSLVDPEVMLTLPKDQTAYTSMDAFYHSIEAFLNIKSNPYSDLLALDSMKRVVTNLPVAFEDGSDIEARTELTWANIEAGITETLTGVIANHCIEHGLSGYYQEITHGLGLCITGPYLFEHFFDDAYHKLAVVGREVFSVNEYDDKRAARLMITKLRFFQEQFNLNKKLSGLGVKKDVLEKIASTAYRTMKGIVVESPGNLEEKDLLQVLEMSY
ncbi:MAG: iron-containing alcohol dehydrogenase [Thermotogota bacterium]|nr:iron-containing alcohol dehydrogenase [Thermotogota bacterium]